MPELLAPAAAVRRLLFCSGRLYFDLEARFTISSYLCTSSSRRDRRLGVAMHYAMHYVTYIYPHICPGGARGARCFRRRHCTCRAAHPLPLPGTLLVAQSLPVPGKLLVPCSNSAPSRTKHLISNSAPSRTSYLISIFPFPCPGTVVAYNECDRKSTCLPTCC